MTQNTRRMTNLELAEWLAKGNGQMRLKNRMEIVTSHRYDLLDDYNQVSDNVLIRPFGDNKWIEPIWYDGIDTKDALNEL